MSKRHQDPKWAASQALSLDYNYAMTDFVGEQGLSESECTTSPRARGPGAGTRRGPGKRPSGVHGPAPPD